MKLRWKILIAVAVVAILMAASLTVTMHVQPQNEVEAYKKLLRNQGEKLEISEILPPRGRPEDNCADAIEEAFRLLGSGNQNLPNAMTMVAPGKALIGSRQPDARGWDFTNSWDEFAGRVEANRPAIELLHEVLERPRLDFQLDYKQGAKLLLPHLAPMKRSAQLLDAASVCQLHEGDYGAATTNILTMLALIQKDSGDCLLISHLVRIALAAIAVNPTWEFLQATNVPDAQLAALQNGWQQLNFLSDAEMTFMTERDWVVDGIEKTRASHDAYKEMAAYGLGSSSGGSGSWPDFIDDATKGLRLAVGEAMWRSSWSYSEELGDLKSFQIVLDAIRAMQTNQSRFYKADYDAMSSRLASLGFTNSGEAICRVLNIPDVDEDFLSGSLLGGALDKTLRIEAARDVVVTAIALKRFQLKHGKWPGTLGELAPEFLTSVPVDPYDGKPLKYHPNADGTFLLYSVGEDGVDDGGDLTPATPSSSSAGFNWLRGKDWVWPQPATPAEVEYFYEHPPK